MTGQRVLRTCGLVALTAVLGLTAFVGLWRLHGGRIERVETASMGTVAPVGSLLWITPVDTSHLRPGDFITFHPPGQPGTTYSHRVYRIYPDGTIGTKGMISAPDPWRLTSQDVVGRVRMTWPGAGWLVRATPVLALGALLVAVAVGRMNHRWRGAATMIGASLVLCTAIVLYRPFVNAEQLAFAPVGDGARATYVSTGLLPLRLQAVGPDGSHIDLRDGQVGSVGVAATGSRGRYAVRLSPAVPSVFWLLLVAACFVPALLSSCRRMLRRRPAAAPRLHARADTLAGRASQVSP
jgi:hypothetical protein